MAGNNWTREELIIAFNLYCKTPFGRIHIRNPNIIDLAKAIGRTPSSVSWKLANFARLDPQLKQRNISGAAHGSKTELEVWDEFRGDWERLSFESEKLLARLMGKSIENVAGLDEREILVAGKEREALIKIRVNQNFFRSTVLAAYDFKCCITGLAIPDLLNASHIAPWSKDSENRVNPCNGLSLNAFHDRAFDRGIITITTEYRVRISKSIQTRPASKATIDLLLKYENTEISLPRRFLPDKKLLQYHEANIFKA